VQYNSAVSSVCLEIFERTFGPTSQGTGDALTRVLETASGRWPDGAIAPEMFALHLATHAKATGDATAYLATVHAADLYLACAIAEGHAFAIVEFERALVSRVTQYIVRISVDPQVVDEVKQQLRQRLLLGCPESGSAKILEYSGKGPLGGWVRVTAVRLALNHLRSQRSATTTHSDEEAMDAPALSGDPELAYIHARSRAAFEDAFKRALEGLDPAERTMLRFHYLQGLTMDQLATMYKQPRSTVARHVAEARARILTLTHEVLRTEHGLSPSALASVFREAKSQLQMTFSRLLK
jgi:RNA polymerase sigma-70 factor, ECF subfamily